MQQLLAKQEQQCWRILDSGMRLTGLGALSNLFLEERSQKRILFAGPAQSGTYFHDHSNAFNLMPHGRKQWVLLPPSGTYEYAAEAQDTESSLTTHEWLRRHRQARRDSLPIEPLHCIQPAGTALFVPSGWAHAVLTPGKGSTRPGRSRRT